MDITFEDVAHVIQDARYQQAILDTTPRPDKRVPNLKRNPTLPQLLDSYGIDCRVVMSEPLGRWFLDKFADLDDKIRLEREGGDPSPRHETKMLKFVSAVYELRRQDPDNNAPYIDILRLLHDFKLETIPIVTAFINDKDQLLPHSLTIKNAIEEAARTSFEDEDSELNAMYLIHEDDGPEDNGHHPLGSTPGELSNGGSSQAAANGDAAAAAAAASTKADGPASPGPPSADPNGAVPGSPVADDDVALSTPEMVRNETQVSRYDPNRTNARGTNNRTTAGATNTRFRTTAGGARMMMTHRGTIMRPHSQRSLVLNDSIEVLMETIINPVFERFYNHKAAISQYMRFKVFALQKITDRQIRYHRVLGQGAFGTVHGCIVAQTGTMLAMKIMSKKRIKVKHSKSQVVAERFALEALANHPSPYCMRLRYAYQTKDAFHLILPLAIGGDLKYHLRKGPFDERRAKFYLAEIAVGLGHIHSLGFIMRDLKPRNILLDSNGHCKISDFGLAASIAEGRKVKGRAGTEGYWSPSVINSIPYGIDADWWSYGCCVFELLAGFNPFSCKHTGLQTRNEGTRGAPIKFTRHVPDSAKPLIKSLLDRDTETRLGCRGDGVDEVLAPKWAFWRGLDMSKIRRGNHDVPWTPEKGVIYAASQSEMLENDDDLNGAALRHIKLTPDDIPEFDDFVDLHDHMEDIVKILTLNSEVQNVLADILKKKSRKETEMQRKKSFVAVPRGACGSGASLCAIS